MADVYSLSLDGHMHYCPRIP